MSIKNKKKIVRDFNNHNQNFFKKKINKTSKIFLIEFNGWSAIHIIFSYLVNFYRNKKNCIIVAYECYDLLNSVSMPWYKKYLWNIGIFLNLKTFKIFKSFGTDKFIKPTFTYNQKYQAKKITNLFFRKKLSLKNLENFKLKEVWIGDLIYDSFLKKNQLNTIDMKSPKFKAFFYECIKLFNFWLNYFEKNNVEAIAGCHAVYLTGIPLRIANKKNINCFAVSGFNCDLVNLKGNISFNEKLSGADIQFKFYKKIITKLSTEHRNRLIPQGKKIIKKIITGKQKYFYIQKSSFLNKNYKIKNTKNNRTKVVIFAHDFSDSPHIYGNHFFPDFQEWFNFLNKIIKKTDYDWYIKDHPASRPLTRLKINELLKSNKNVKFLKKDFPNSKLKNLGINFVLTVYGTVASELSFYGIKVISASKNHPHSDFNFSINPKNQKEYEKILLSLKNNKFKIHKNDIYHFHYVKELLSKMHIFFKNHDRYFGNLNEKPLRFTPLVYKYWLEDFNLERHYKILDNLENFINKEEYLYFEH